MTDWGRGPLLLFLSPVFTLPHIETRAQCAQSWIYKRLVVLADDASHLVPLFSLHNLTSRYFDVLLGTSRYFDILLGTSI